MLALYFMYFFSCSQKDMVCIGNIVKQHNTYHSNQCHSIPYFSMCSRPALPNICAVTGPVSKPRLSNITSTCLSIGFVLSSNWKFWFIFLLSIFVNPAQEVLLIYPARGGNLRWLRFGNLYVYFCFFTYTHRFCFSHF